MWRAQCIFESLEQEKGGKKQTIREPRGNSRWRSSSLIRIMLVFSSIMLSLAVVRIRICRSSEIRSPRIRYFFHPLFFWMKSVVSIGFRQYCCLSMRRQVSDVVFRPMRCAVLVTNRLLPRGRFDGALRLRNYSRGCILRDICIPIRWQGIRQVERLDFFSRSLKSPEFDQTSGVIGHSGLIRPT